MIPLVVASERGLAQTNVVTAILGLQDHDVARNLVRRTLWKMGP